jgi:CDP-diacylglycerol--glycerol-3-phosphate 3-phosphatidyltransferase
MIDTSSNTPPPLESETKLIRNLGLSLLIVFTAFSSFIWSLWQAFQWFIQTGFLWFLAISIVGKQLDLNRPSQEQALYLNLGWANRLTLFRGFLIAFTAGFLFQANLTGKVLLIPAFSYFIAAVIDRIDGYIARLTNHESLLGTNLDIEFDALGLLIAPLLAIWIGQIHWSYLLVSVAYYLFQWGLYWRKRQQKPVYHLPLNMSRRAIAGFQMGFLAVVLWPILAPPATTIAGFAFMLPLLGGFVLDWLIVSGRINLKKTAINNFFKLSEQVTHKFLLPAFRVIIFLLLCLALQKTHSFSLLINEITLSKAILILSLLLSALMILLGILGRFFAIILSCLLCWFFLSYEMQILDVILLILVIWVMQFGTGKFSLWLWDDLWVHRYDGA